MGIRICKSCETVLLFSLLSTFQSLALMSLPRARLACLLALQIWDTELGNVDSGDAITTDVIVPTEVSDLLADIIHAVRACLEAFRHRGILDPPEYRRQCSSIHSTVDGRLGRGVHSRTQSSPTGV